MEKQRNLQKTLDSLTPPAGDRIDTTKKLYDLERSLSASMETAKEWYNVLAKDVDDIAAEYDQAFKSIYANKADALKVEKAFTGMAETSAKVQRTVAELYTYQENLENSLASQGKRIASLDRVTSYLTWVSLAQSVFIIVGLALIAFSK
jgi:hypothetical protein